MVSIRVPRSEAWIQHPNIPELRVLVEEPSLAEYGRRQYELSKLRLPVAVRDAVTGSLIRDEETGKVVTEVPAIQFDPQEVDSFLKDRIKNVEGIEETDAPIEEVLAAFGERRFFVKDDSRKAPAISDQIAKVLLALPVADAIREQLKTALVKILAAFGVKEGPSITPFKYYLFQKVLSEDTFNHADPLAKSSVSQPTSG